MMNLNKFLISLLLGALLLTGCATAPQATSTPRPTATPSPTSTPEPTPTPEWEREGWTLVWQDEFDGEALDSTNWVFDIGGHGWGNNELQAYTDRPENARVEDGLLVIEAREEEFVRRNYTSARIKTQGLLAWTYGRFEARMQLPAGNGIWPAFWMLGADFETVGWPACGEIDIMEHIGREPNRIHGTVHGPGYSGSGGVGHYTTVPDLAEAFHVYAVEWEPEEIRWYVDDEEYFKLTPQSVRGDWVYDHPFFLLLNLAVGGEWPGPPDDSTVFPQFLKVDYVRVYQRPDMVEAMATERGVMHVGDIVVTAEENADGTWQAIVAITIVDAAGNPVTDANVSGGWVGAIRRGETEGQTDADGVITLRSESSERRGEVTFCVTNITRPGFTYDKTANTRTCDKITTE